ncbi:MAG: dihydrolipoamide acetyltransferase family protein [Aeromicrobium sp.]
MSGGANEFRLPDVGEGLTEAEIVSWRVSVGDVVEVNDVIVEIETAKSLVELPSPFAGEVTALLVAEGDTVEVGRPIIAIGGGAAPVPEAAPERQAMLVGYGPRAETSVRRRRSVARPVTSAEPEVEPARRPLARPPVRKLAKDLGIDLSTIVTTGEIVTRADVEAAAASLVEPSATTSQGDVRIPVKGVRKATAEAMVRSAFTAPHVTEWVTLDVSRTMDLVARLKADRAFAGVRISPTVVVAKAICLALRRTPELNAAWDEQAREIVLKGSVNLGVAAATERGLVVPTIAGADRMSLVELATAIGELTASAREGRTQPAQMSGGTFTLTNIGVFGVDAGTPILNPGESGILALGSIQRRPWVDEHDDVVARWITTLALSFDHRIVDGEQGSRFLADVASILREPDLALAY